MDCVELIGSRFPLRPRVRYDVEMRAWWVRAGLLSLSVLLLGPLLVGQASLPPKAKAGAGLTQACGPLADGLLKCPRFGFTYKTVLGWVDRTDDMQPDSDAGTSSGGEAGSPKGDKSETLLAVFERPPAAPGDSINSAVIIVAESLADYHGIKTAADYFGPITELAEQRGFKVENDPDVFSVGAKQLVRGDFSKPRGQLTMWQSSLVMIEKGYIVSFTFVSGSRDEVDELIENLSFGARAVSTH
jgi:hypothetical protein